MKRTMAVILLATMTVVSMAQPPHGGRGPERHEQHDRHDHRHDQRHIECATHDQLHISLKAIEDQSFDEKKVEIAELCVTLGRFCTDDLERMARTFSFDENRKKFLIYAHRYVTDPQNYYSLRDVFEFRSNFDEMMDQVKR